MKRFIILIVLIFAFSACKSHHHRIDGNHLILTLRHPDAKKVVLFCSLDGFEPRDVKKDSYNWVSELPADETFRYFYQVDGKPFVPNCPLREKDDFGLENCIYDPHL
jgi:hypothetical protein